MSEMKWQTLVTNQGVATHFPKWRDRIAVLLGRPITVDFVAKVEVLSDKPVRQTLECN